MRTGILTTRIININTARMTRRANRARIRIATRH